ncbi:unnamed protein product, partial [Ascophyllum nodosum]
MLGWVSIYSLWDTRSGYQYYRSSLCMSFQVLIQLGGCTNFSRKEIKGSGG